MTASVEFVSAIQDRLGEGTEYRTALRACVWLDRRSPIDPCWGAGDVRRYLACLGLDANEPDGDYTTQECGEKAAKVWDEMVAAVMLDEPEEKKCPSISVDYRSYNSMTGKIYFELVVCWVDHRYEESGDIDIPDSLKLIIGKGNMSSEDELNDVLFAYSKHVTKHYEEMYHQNPDGFREAYGPIGA